MILGLVSRGSRLRQRHQHSRLPCTLHMMFAAQGGTCYSPLIACFHQSPLASIRTQADAVPGCASCRRPAGEWRPWPASPQPVRRGTAETRWPEPSRLDARPPLCVVSSATQLTFTDNTLRHDNASGIQTANGNQLSKRVSSCNTQALGPCSDAENCGLCSQRNRCNGRVTGSTPGTNIKLLAAHLTARPMCRTASQSGDWSSVRPGKGLRMVPRNPSSTVQELPGAPWLGCRRC